MKKLMFCILVTVVSVACGDDGGVPIEGNNGGNNGEVDAGGNNGGANNGANNGGTDAGNNGGVMCPAAQELCGELCVSTDTSMDHCGSCDSPCVAPANANAECVGGDCQISCKEGFSDDNDDLSTSDSDGCETQNVSCDAGEEVCNGTCTDTTSNLDHCGSCNSPCPTKTNTNVTCESSGCVYECKTGFTDDDNDLTDPNSNGCESTVSGELCNGMDDNNNGEVDEDFTNKGESCSVGEGVCENTGQYECSNDGTTTVCSASEGSPDETPEETCDGKDNDCDGNVDEGCDDDNDGYCDESFTTNGAPSVCPEGGGDCDDNDDTVYPDGPPGCDGKDNDCDGTVDDIEPRVSGSTPTYDSSLNKNDYSVNTNSAMGARGNDGFCGAVLSESNKDIDFFFLSDNGNSQSFSHNFGGITASTVTNILDVASDGTSCAFLLQRGGDQLRLYRWTPGSTNLHVGEITDNSVNSTTNPVNPALRRTFQTAAVHYSDDLNEWVVTWIQDTIGSNAIQHGTFPTSFTSAADIRGTGTTIVKASGKFDVDVGPAPNSNDDFLVVLKDSPSIGADRLRFFSVAGGADSERGGLEVTNAEDLVNPSISETDGRVFVSYHDVQANERHLREVTSTYTWGASGVESVTASDPEEYLMKDLVGSDPAPITWFVAPWAEEVFTFEPSSGNSSVLDFQFRDHPDFTAGDVYLTLGGTTEGLRVLTLTNDSPYQVKSHGFICF